MCWLLQHIHQLDYPGDKPGLKGSFLHSKNCPLFNRLPRDIDLIMSYQALPVEIDLDTENWTDVQQQKFIRQFFDAKSDYIANTFAPAVSAVCKTTLREPWQVSLTAPYQAHLIFHYPTAFASQDYEALSLVPSFEVDISFVNAPAELASYPRYTIKPLLLYPDLATTHEACVDIRIQPSSVSFCDNLSSLHRYARLPIEIIAQELKEDKFHAAIYYDLAIKYQSSAIPSNIAQVMRTLFMHTKYFFPHKKFDQLAETFKPGTLSLMPPAPLLSMIEEKYTEKVRAARGSVLTFDEALKVLAELENKINQFST